MRSLIANWLGQWLMKTACVFLYSDNLLIHSCRFGKHGWMH